MKKVSLQTVDMDIGEETVKLVYKDQIRGLMMVPFDTEKGTNYEEMIAIIPILEKFKNCIDDYILLEDAEHAEVVKRLKAAKFRTNAPEIYAMLDTVINAPDHLIEAVHANDTAP